MRGEVVTTKLTLNDEVVHELKNKYIAIDVETTGLDDTKCVITEIALVEFVNGKINRTYSSLVHINELVSDKIIDITGITNEMLRNAPSEEQVYKEVTNFLHDALEEKEIMVAHNASFDMGFLYKALERFGYLGSIKYVDTLSISRSLIKGLFNYTQTSVATYFGIVNRRAHRALTDAEVCGKILYNLINIYDSHSQIIFTTKYDNYFEERVRERGIIYFQESLVKDYHEDRNTCSCTIMGANKYNTSITLMDNETLKGTCTCPYVQENPTCKHMYALLLHHEMMKGNDQFSTIIDNNLLNEYESITDDIDDLLEKVEEFYNSIGIDKQIPIEDIYEDIMLNDDYKEEYQEISEQTIDDLTDLYDELDSMFDNMKDIIDNIDDEDDEEESENDEEERKTKPLYEDYNYEEENLEEDDFYYEDD